MAWMIVGALVLVCASTWSAVYAQTPRPSGVLTVAMLSVGQGDALYIESPTGVQVLIDGGPDDALLRELPLVMPALDRSLDAVIATHPDADHVGGLTELLRRYEVAVFVEPGLSKDTATAAALSREVAEQKIPRVLARRGMEIDLGDGAQLRVLYPDRDVAHLSDAQVNEGGIVMELVYGESEMLLMADVGQGVEQKLLILDKLELDTDVLKVGHHGSRFSTSEAFVQAASPNVALISVGAKNSYGHPTVEVLERLGRHNIKILRTDKSGTIRCVSYGATFTCSK